MPRSCEILFVDPAISDLGTILSALRPGVDAIVLDSARSPARQIATALEGRNDIAAVHVIAHGAPGRVNFAAGEWSAETLAAEADDLAVLGQALGAGGDLRLWSCNSGAGEEGADFVRRLSQATGAKTSFATYPIGAAALGGRWELLAHIGDAIAEPPLTATGIASYTGVFPSLTSTGTGDPIEIFGAFPAGTSAGTYFIVLDNGGTLEILGEFDVVQNTAGTLAGTFAVNVSLPAGTYNVGGSGSLPGDISVYSGVFNKNTGTWSL